MANESLEGFYIDWSQWIWIEVGFESRSVFGLIHRFEEINAVDAKRCGVMSHESVFFLSEPFFSFEHESDFCVGKALFDDGGGDADKVSGQQRSAHQREVFGADQQGLVQPQPRSVRRSDVVVQLQQVAGGDLVLVKLHRNHGEKTTV